MTTTTDQLQAQIDQIEQELGVSPEGIYASVRTRLDILEARINNPYAPAPAVENPFYIGYTGVSIQTGVGDPNVLMLAGVPSSLYLRQDGYGPDQGLYSYSPDGYWEPIGGGAGDNFAIGGDLTAPSVSTQKVIGIDGFPLSGTPEDGYTLLFSSSLSQWQIINPGGRSLVKTGNYNLLSGDGDIFCSLSSAAISFTLPATPYLGEKHGFKDLNDLAATHNITIIGDGFPVEQYVGGVASNLVITQNGASVVLQFTGTKWNIV